MTKKQNPFEQIEEFNRRLTDFTLQFSKAITGSMAPAIRSQANIAAESLEKLMENSEKMMKIKSPDELIEHQTELANELANNFQANVQKLMEAQKAFSEEMQKLLEEGQKAYNFDALKSMFEQK
ncbi:MAG: phasin family protein [Gammaproteobacteria bacterium]|nr:phasin family protein [Gammaproteobacteria bacterium]